MNDVVNLGWPTMSGTGEALLFWSTAAIMVLAAIGVLLFRKAAYAALCMVVVMLGMAVLFIALQAPFNGMVQVIVYTGAIMMLFLFVIMMIGLGATDGYRQQRRGYVVFAGALGIALAVMTVAAVLTSTVTGTGTISEDPYSNAPVTSLAINLFQDHWLTIQLAAMLLIIAAVGAVLLTHSDRLSAKFTQRRTAEARMVEYAVKGAHVGQLPAPGVYATSNAVDNPAIAGDTLDVVEESIPRVLRLRGLEKPLGAVSPEVAESLRLVRSTKTGNKVSSSTTNRPYGIARVPQSGTLGMPGQAAPSGLVQVSQADIKAANQQVAEENPETNGEEDNK